MQATEGKHKSARPAVVYVAQDCKVLIEHLANSSDPRVRPSELVRSLVRKEANERGLDPDTLKPIEESPEQEGINRVS